MAIFIFDRRGFLGLLVSSGLLPLTRKWFPSLGALINRSSGATPTRDGDNALPDIAHQSVPGAASPDNGPRIFRSRGGEYKNIIQNFVVEFLNHYQAKRPYAISRIFQIFPFQVTDRGKANDLINRGAINFSGDISQNSGEKVEVQFTDQHVGKLSVVFKSEIQAKIANISKRGFSLTFDAAHQVPVVFYELDPKHEMGPNQVLESIDFSPALVSYTLHEVGHESQKIRIEIDLSRSDIQTTQPAERPKGAAQFRSEKTAALIPASLSMIAAQSSNASQTDACRDTRFQVGGIRSDCCGGHEANGQPCTTGPGTPQQLEDHPVTFVNKAAMTLYIYYAIYSGGTYDCLNLSYDGTLADGQQKTYTVPPRKTGWFKFQENTSGAGCPISNNKFEVIAYGGSSTEEILYIW